MVKHGGLNQVGKVRGLTPKVDKEDIPKKPKGRANMRRKYNRRYKYLYADEKTKKRKQGLNSQAERLKK